MAKKKSKPSVLAPKKPPVKSTVKSPLKTPVKPTVKNRGINAGVGEPPLGDAFSNQDAKRRLGNFEGAGEHARVGGRKGIVGQTTKTFRTDNRTTKSTKGKKK